MRPASSWCMLRVESDAVTDVGALMPQLGGGALRYDPLPARMVTHRRRLRFVYFDGNAPRVLTLGRGEGAEGITRRRGVSGRQSPRRSRRSILVIACDACGTVVDLNSLQILSMTMTCHVPFFLALSGDKQTIGGQGKIVARTRAAIVPI